MKDKSLNTENRLTDHEFNYLILNSERNEFKILLSEIHKNFSLVLDKGH